MTFILTIPMTPPSVNVYLRMFWADRERLKDTWHTAVWALANEARWEPVEVASIVVTIFFRDSRKRDLANWISTSDKLIVDGLVRCGILPDDDPAHLKSLDVRIEKGAPRTEILLTPLDK